MLLRQRMLRPPPTVSSPPSRIEYPIDRWRDNTERSTVYTRIQHQAMYDPVDGVSQTLIDGEMRFLCRAETANRTNRSSPRECVLSGGAQGKIWFDTTPPDDVLRTVQPLDEPVLSHRATVIVPGPKGLELASDVLGADDVGRQRLRFDEWFERLLATRGMVDTMWSTPKVESEDPLECDFARLGAVFDDVDPKLFQ